ncbi:glycerophosphoryl diester phosphodiesterase membrane domain-containing protein [Ornithinimicrobium tianjinense]|uniref:DUF7847 domain-containing protein n=1 Tax=Ornithinimicrobium tianjinense TaxID=1195761 RepID=A0A917BP23_9MICO|nr:glycerophosphoryl diester phosphodiesterase membrane domain-containing protein [Ornithinimicrobium tianjinense]GGF51350.1 hypothetical protein GCM10011366_19000 [Ornithinimicrobium tianjinense]
MMTYDQGARPDLPPPGAPTAAPPPLPPPGSPSPIPGMPLPPPQGAPGGTAYPWQSLPPEQLARMHQPGVVPLRPLFLGDIFAGALQTMRRNPAATIGTALVVLSALLVPSYLISVLLTGSVDLAEEDLAALTTMLSVLFGGLASIALAGMIVHVVGEAVLGDRVTLGQTWAAVRGRIPALLGAVLLIALVFVAATVALVVAVASLFVAIDAASGGVLAALVVALVLVGLGAVVLVCWLSAKVSLTTAAVVLEKAGPWSALRRSWALTRGRQAWRVFGITLLAGILTTIFSTAVQLPVTIGVFLALDGISGGLSSTHPVVLLTDHVVQLVVQAFAIPFSAGVTALVYLDQRIRREGLDVTLIGSAQARAAARAR